MSRKEKLTASINNAIQCLTNRNESYQFEGKQLLNAKTMLSDVNNLITLIVTEKFIEFLKDNKYLDSPQCKKIKAIVNGINANANGYDIEFDDNKLPIIAEVKCNIPVAVKRFGAAQKKGIIKDINGLITGKTKSAIKDTSKYYKFMVVLEVDGIKDAMNHIVKNFKFRNVCVLNTNNNNSLDKQTVYIVYIDLE